MADEFNDIMEAFLTDVPPGYRYPAFAQQLREAASLYSIVEVESLLGSYVSNADFDSFSTSVSGSLELLAPLSSPTFTGEPAGPTPTQADNSTRFATTAWVTAKLSGTFAANLIAQVAVRYDAAQSLTAVQKSRARNNIDVGAVAGFRNKLINGKFSVNQRGMSLPAGTGYRFQSDRWYSQSQGSTMALSIQDFPNGSGDVPKQTNSFQRISVVTGGTASAYSIFGQKIENVRTLAGRKATLTFYARRLEGAAPIYVEIFQRFGSGSPSVRTPVGTFTLSSIFQKFTTTIDIPSIVGKVIAGPGVLELRIFLDAGTDYAADTNSLGNRSGTYDFSTISLVDGDATLEDDPYDERHIQQELKLCERYTKVLQPGNLQGPIAHGFVILSGNIARLFLYTDNMRDLPSISSSAPSDFEIVSATGPRTPSNIGVHMLAPNMIALEVAMTSTAPDGEACYMRSVSTAAKITIDAEL